MRDSFLSIGVFVIVCLATAGCSKTGSSNDDRTPPAIVIQSPSDGQVFTAGQSILIHGTVTDNSYIAELHIHVYNDNTNSLLMDVHIYPGAASAVFDQPLTATSGLTYRIQIVAKDRAVNESTSTVRVTCN